MPEGSEVGNAVDSANKRRRIRPRLSCDLLIRECSPTFSLWMCCWSLGSVKAQLRPSYRTASSS
jgi:hypothetical protein